MDSLDDIKRRFMAKAEQVFEKMFAEKEQAQLVTFTQRERRACKLGDDLIASLLEDHASADPAAKPSAPAVCPRCARPGKPAAKVDDPLPARDLKCETGDVRLRRERWYCKGCRLVFFPLG